MITNNKPSINTQYFAEESVDTITQVIKGYGCQTTLLKIIEDWKKALDQNKFVAAILMDLFKAFDCLPHDLLLLKLKSYCVAPSSLNLLESYLNNRKQCVKVGTHSSNWKTVFKGDTARINFGIYYLIYYLFK